MARNSRGNWASSFEFLFSYIGGMVRLSNIWRFPYVYYKNGGVVFLVPYLFFMIVLAIPLVFLESTYAQYSNLGPGRVWLCCPLFKGIGNGMLAYVAIFGIYYNVLVSYTLYYLGNSFYSILPWSNCNNDWNTDACFTRRESNSGTIIKTNMSVVYNSTGINSFFNRKRISSGEEFWENHVLDITDSIEVQGHLRWQLVICLFVSWTVLFLSVLKGIKTSSKVMYVALTILFVVLIVLHLRVVFLPGSMEGLQMMYKYPEWKKLRELSVWCVAAIEVFYSSGIGMGGIITLASYNKFHNNCYRDAIVLSVFVTLTNLFVAWVVFATLGYMAEKLDVSLEQVANFGPGLGFGSYPEALATLPLPQIWSVLFFLLLFIAGLSTMIVKVQVITTGIFDNFPNIGQKGKTITRLVVCILGFVLGLACVTQGGIYIIHLIDFHSANVGFVFLLLLEVIVLAWIYGTERLYQDLKMMIGFQPNFIWKIFWKIICPVMVLFVWIVNVVQYKKYGSITYGSTSYPQWAIGVGWTIALIPIMMVPLGMVHSIISTQGNIVYRLSQNMHPSARWRPALINRKVEITLGEINLKEETELNPLTLLTISE